jgi:hypothetical protein
MNTKKDKISHINKYNIYTKNNLKMKKQKEAYDSEQSK